MIGCAAAVSAQTNIQGRWEFVVISGDTQTQLSEFGQSSFSTYLTQAGPSLRNIKAFTTDFVACDLVSNNNITVIGTIDASGTTNITFTVALPDNTNFQYVFNGLLTVGTPNITPTVINGTYQRSAEGGARRGVLEPTTPTGISWQPISGI
jgi:hypothetical protein